MTPPPFTRRVTFPLTVIAREGVEIPDLEGVEVRSSVEGISRAPDTQHVRVLNWTDERVTVTSTSRILSPATLEYPESYDADCLAEPKIWIAGGTYLETQNRAEPRGKQICFAVPHSPTGEIRVVVEACRPLAHDKPRETPIPDLIWP